MARYVNRRAMTTAARHSSQVRDLGAARDAETLGSPGGRRFRDPSAPSSPAPIDFDQLLAAARRQARVVATAAAVGLAARLRLCRHGGAAISRRRPTSSSTAKGQERAVAASIAELTFDTGAIDSQVEVLKSEKIALSVISTMNLTHDPEFMGSRGTLIGQAFGLLRVAVRLQRLVHHPAEIGRRRRRRAWSGRRSSQLKANLDVRRVARTYVLAVDYTSPDRDKAAAIANAFAEAYLTDQLDAKFDATRRAAGWLQTRARRTEAAIARRRLRHSEIQGGQGHRRHRRRQSRADLRSAAHRAQRADGAWRAPTPPRRRRATSKSRTC